MYYIIYKIINQIDGKLYIGSHKTKDLNDSYMGSGKYLLRAQTKYGIENFTKQILFIFNNAEEMYAKEAEIVNEDFIAEKNTYNVKVGGFGGWSYINSRLTSEEKSRRGKRINEIYGPEHRIQIGLKGSEKTMRLRLGIHGMTKSQRQAAYGMNADKIKEALARLETNEKRKATYALRGHQCGPKNSQYGTLWITDGTKSLKIKRDEKIPEGFKPGRVIKRNKELTNEQ